MKRAIWIGITGICFMLGTAFVYKAISIVSGGLPPADRPRLMSLVTGIIVCLGVGINAFFQSRRLGSQNNDDQ